MIIDCIEDTMADIATIFTGFSLESMGAMEVEELIDWRERARIRSEANS